MELIAKVLYDCPEFRLLPGETTEGRGISEEKKQQMITDFPDWFAVVEQDESLPVKPSKRAMAEMETPEDELDMEIPEYRSGPGRPRKR